VRAASLFVVLILAKVLTLAGRNASWSFPASLGYFWQDAAVALVAAAIDISLRRPRIGWAAYALVVGYAAINVPIARVLSSPLTWPMIHAARGPLADSIARYLDWVSFGAAGLVVAAGVGVSWLLRRQPQAVYAWVMVVAACVVIAGFRMASEYDTVGLDRNAITALVATPALPRVEASPLRRDWRVSPFASIAPSVTTGREKLVPARDLTQLSGAARGLNVLVVILESTGARYLKPYGAPDDPMPNLTALTHDAIVFDNAYAVYPESIKGLFATLCSRYPAFGVSAEQHADVPCAPIAKILGAAGYRTALFHSGRFRYLGMQEILERQGFDVLEDAGAIGGVVRSSFGVDEPSTVARILRWIDAQDSRQPFFVAYLPAAGHHPYAIPDSAPVVFPPATDSGRYRNALHYADAALGALLAGLKTRGIADRTLVVVFGDHGEAFGQHPGNIGHSLFLNEENVRVPYAIALPGRIKGELRVHRLASLLDTAPTILDLTGLPRSPEHEGLSLLRPGEPMALFHTDYSLGWLGLRDGCWKYLFEIDDGRSKLFDLCHDPDETVDRSGAHTDRVRAYHDRVIAWSAAERDLVLSSYTSRR